MIAAEATRERIMFFAAHASTPPRIGVVVIHRDALVRAGLLAALSQNDAFRVVEGIAASAITDPAAVPDDVNGEPVILADYEAALDIVGTARQGAMSTSRRVPRVMVVTHRDRESEIRHALERGILGYLMVGCAIPELLDGVRALHRDDRFISAPAAQRLAESLSHPSLTTRESAVLQRLCAGHSNKSIAQTLDIAVGTVKAHVRSILDKLDASTRTEAAAIARARGLCPDAGDRGNMSGRGSGGLRGDV